MKSTNRRVELSGEQFSVNEKEKKKTCERIQRWEEIHIQPSVEGGEPCSTFQCAGVESLISSRNTHRTESCVCACVCVSVKVRSLILFRLVLPGNKVSFQEIKSEQHDRWRPHYESCFKAAALLRRVKKKTRHRRSDRLLTDNWFAGNLY